MRILIVGCGSIGARHARNTAPLADIAICDTDVQKVQVLAKELDCGAYTDFQEALSTKPDGVIIALPNKHHYSAAKAALETGAYVLVEKPLCHTLDDARELVKLGRDRLRVVSNMRFHEAVLALKAGLQHIGKPLFARAHFGNYLPSMRPHVDYRTLYVAKREDGGGALIDCIHELDYLAHLFGPPKAISATLSHLSDLEIETEDYAALNILYGSGFRSEIHLDYLQQFKQRGCEVIGTEGTVIWRSMGKAPEHCKVEYYTAQSGAWHTLLDTQALDLNACYVELVKAFMDVITGKGSPILSTAQEGLDVLESVFAAYRSAEEGGTIPLPLSS